jgi:hypothetical protein
MLQEGPVIVPLGQESGRNNPETMDKAVVCVAAEEEGSSVVIGVCASRKRSFRFAFSPENELTYRKNWSERETF